MTGPHHSGNNAKESAWDPVGPWEALVRTDGGIAERGSFLRRVDEQCGDSSLATLNKSVCGGK